MSLVRVTDHYSPAAGDQQETAVAIMNLHGPSFVA